MNKWNYKQANKFFAQNTPTHAVPETEVYIRSLPWVPTQDIRRMNNLDLSVVLGAITNRSMILVDGPSNNGKSTFAKRLAKKINAEVIDIDILCVEWMEKQSKTIQNEFERVMMLLQMDQMTDKYLEDNMERIIRQKSTLNRPVILVGMFVDLIARSIVVKTLGKYFDNVISILVCENTYKDMQKLIRFRDKEMGWSRESDNEDCKRQFEYTQRLIAHAGAMQFGFGMRKSFIINTRVSDMFL